MDSFVHARHIRTDAARGLDLSIVVPAYDEAGNLQRLHRELQKVLDELSLTWELIVCDDGSKDGTWEEIVRLHEADRRAKGLRLSRNFGHQNALLAGLVHARGRAVISMDADLQHPPRLVADLVNAWQSGAKIVHTVRRDDETTPWLKKLTSRAFYRLYSFLCGVDLEEGMADFRLLDRDVLDVLLRFPEQGVFLRGLVQWVGFPSAKVPFEVGQRFSGRPKYTFRKMLSFAWSGISSFSVIPLRLGVLVGLLTGGLALLELTYVVCVRLFTDSAVSGWASMIGVMSLLFAILFVLLGVIGEYIGRVLIEVKGRPRYLVMDEIGIAVPATALNTEHVVRELTHGST